MTPGEASPITSTQLGGLASRRYFLMHIPMKHTPTLGHSASFLDSVCVCASHNTPLPQLPPLFFPPCQGSKFGPVSYTPTFHVSWLRPLGDRGTLLLCQFEVVFSAVSVFLLHALPQLARWQPQHGHSLRYQRRARHPEVLLSYRSAALSIVGPPGGLKKCSVSRSRDGHLGARPPISTSPTVLPSRSCGPAAPSGHVALRNDTTSTSRVMATSTSTTTPMRMQSPRGSFGAEGTRWQWRASPVALFWWPAGPSWRQVWF